MLINSASEKEILWISLKKWYLLNNNVYCSWIFKKTEIFWSLQMNIFIEVENGNFDLSPLLDDGTTLLHSDWSPWLNAGSLLAVRSKRENLIKITFQDVHFHQQLLLSAHSFSTVPSVTLRRLNMPNYSYCIVCYIHNYI